MRESKLRNRQVVPESERRSSKNYFTKERSTSDVQGPSTRDVRRDPAERLARQTYRAVQGSLDAPAVGIFTGRLLHACRCLLYCTRSVDSIGLDRYVATPKTEPKLPVWGRAVSSSRGIPPPAGVSAKAPRRGDQGRERCQGEGGRSREGARRGERKGGSPGARADEGGAEREGCPERQEQVGGKSAVDLTGAGFDRRQHHLGLA